MLPAETQALTGILAVLADLYNAPPRHLTQEQWAQLRHLRRRAVQFVQYRLRQLTSDQERAEPAARSVQARLDGLAAAPGPGLTVGAADGNAVTGAPPNPTDEKIIKLVRRKAMKGETIANNLGLSYGYVRRRLALLVKKGRLRPTDNGYRTSR
jgi:hypothetical protein